MEKRILDLTTLYTVDQEIWMDIDLPGMLVRLKMTLEELDDLLSVGKQVREQYVEHNGHIIHNSVEGC